MNIIADKYIRKPFEVLAIRVTEENMKAIAEWCESSLGKDPERGNRDCINVAVRHAINDRQSKAFVGDWVLKATSGFKVYTNSAFEKTFDRAPENSGGVVNHITVINTEKSPSPQQLADLVNKVNGSRT